MDCLFLGIRADFWVFEDGKEIIGLVEAVHLAYMQMVFFQQYLTTCAHQKGFTFPRTWDEQCKVESSWRRCEGWRGGIQEDRWGYR